MQMIFICNELRYRFGFEIFQGKVLTEWLYVLLKGSTKESYCFKREGQNIKVNSKVMNGTRGITAKQEVTLCFFLRQHSLMCLLQWL